MVALIDHVGEFAAGQYKLLDADGETTDWSHPDLLPYAEGEADLEPGLSFNNHLLANIATTLRGLA